MRVIILFLVFLLPLNVSASQEHHSNAESHLHAMSVEGYNELLSPVEVRGIRAIVYIKDIDKSMAGKMPHTHHFMVVFEGNDGKPHIDGKVFLISAKDDEPIQKIPLAKMKDQFGTDLVLVNHAIYKFTVEHIESSGETRQYPFVYTTK